MQHERRYLAVYLPYLPANRILRAGKAPPDSAFVLTEKQRGAIRIVSISAAAAAMGLTAGLTLADARAQIPGLIAYDADPAGDQHTLERLADYCQRYTPRVAPSPPCGLLLDISGAAYVFGGREDRLSDDLAQRFTGMGFALRRALSASSSAALALAAYGLDEGQVHALPVSALRTGPDIHHALRRAGLPCIGDVASRPRAVLAARFGKGMTDALAQLLGEIDTPIIPRRTPPMVHVQARFAEPLGHADAARNAIFELAEDAANELNLRGQGARSIEAALFRCDGHVARLMVETAAPTRDTALIMRLFEERIAGLNDPLDPGFGYDMITLGVTAMEPLLPGQMLLSGERHSRADIGGLLARLATRLGKAQVTVFAVRDTHIPEAAAYDWPATSPAPPSILTSHAWITPSEDEPPKRPVMLFDPPQPIEVLAEVPDGPPHRFRWQKRLHQVRLHEGPERIALPWWRGQGFDRLTRDYYRIEDTGGHRYWVFRHGLYTEKGNPNWYMHGVFA
jgi:protein ImuB